MDVELARDEHLQRIVELWDLLARAHEERDRFFRRAPEAEAHFRARVSECMRSEDALLVVCEDRGRVIGYAIALVRPNPPVLSDGVFGLIDHLVVDPAERRRGAGSLLLDSASEWLVSRGVARVEVEVAESNSEGMAFWRSKGFEGFQRTLFRPLGPECGPGHGT